MPSKKPRITVYLSPEDHAVIAATAARAGIAQRKERLEAVKAREDAALAAIRQQWVAKRQEIEENTSLLKRNRRNLLTLARKHEAEALAKAKLALLPESEAVRREIPYTSWSGFLRHEAEQGNEIALAVQRSRSEAVEPEEPRQSNDRAAAITVIHAEYTEIQRQLQQRPGLSASGKQSLQAFLRMEQVAAEARAQGAGLGDIKRRIDGKGVVIFSLEGGGTIRDTGKEIFFSAHDDTVERTARLYAAKKWGKNLALGREYTTLEPGCCF